MIVLQGNELVSVYLLLKENEEKLDHVQLSIKNKAEKILFEALSIEELESIEDLYKKNVDVLEKKL